jgi:uroporphyrinogen-III synthase
MSSDIEPLAGFTIGITAARRREEFGAALARRGATVVYAPAIRIVPLADDTELLDATRRCLTAPLDVVVATTGIGFRGWMEAADAWGLADELTAGFEAATLLARGPKARGAIRARGLHDSWSPESESTSEVLAYLLERFELDGIRIALQLHGEPLTDVVSTLRAAGAEVIEVPVYRWLPPADEEPLQRLLQSVVGGGVDAVAFTSAPAAVSFLRTADKLGLGDEVRAALRTSVLPAGVGPVTAAPLEREGITVVQPPRARLGSLVRTLVEQVPVHRGSMLVVAGHVLEVRGHAVVLDGELSPLTGAAMAMLRALIRQPGQVVSVTAMLAALPGEGRDEHAVEVAIGRLRTALGDPRCLQTVGKRGSRLACDPDPTATG